MISFFSLVFVLAYFSVFFFGLFACFYLASKYFKSRYFFKAGSTFTLALLAIGGLFQAIVGA